MKRLINLLLFISLVTTAIAQQKPVYERTRSGQVVSDAGLQAKYFFALPTFDIPTIPGYVPDSLRYRALFKLTGNNGFYPEGFYGYRSGQLQRLSWSDEAVPSIFNQNAAQQLANYWINGIGKYGYVSGGRGVTVDETGVRVNSTDGSGPGNQFTYLSSTALMFSSYLPGYWRADWDIMARQLNINSGPSYTTVTNFNTVLKASRAPVEATDVMRLEDGNAYAQKTGQDFTGKVTAPAIYTGDSTRNITMTFVGTSITVGSGYGTVVEPDSNYVQKIGRILGLQTINYGLSGRTVEQVTAGDSSAYSKRNNTPSYTPGSFIGCECLVNDAIKDSTVYNVSAYTTQLAAWVDAQIAKGYPANHILLFNTTYFNPPAYPTYPNIEARHDQFAAAMQAVATEKGTLFYDGYYSFKTAWQADASILESALLHPTAKGHTRIANDLSAFLLSVIVKVNLADQKNKVIGSQKVYGDQEVTHNARIGDDAYVGNNLTVTNKATAASLNLTKSLTALPPNSTQPFLARDVDGTTKTRLLSKPDLQYVFGSNGTALTVLDFNDPSNTGQGWSDGLLRGSTAANAPISGSTAFWMISNAEHGTAKNGTGNIRQDAIAYGDATSLAVGDFFRWRFSNTWTNWKHKVHTNAVLPANGQLPIGNGTDYTVGNITGTANQITVANSAGGINLSLSSSFVIPAAATATTQPVTDNSNKPATTANVQSHFLTASATLDFASTAAQTSSELTITVTGAADGDVVSVGVPNASSNVNSCFTARVSAANTVTVKFNNYSASSIDPASGIFKVTVFK